MWGVVNERFILQLAFPVRLDLKTCFGLIASVDIQSNHIDIRGSFRLLAP